MGIKVTKTINSMIDQLSDDFRYVCDAFLDIIDELPLELLSYNTKQQIKQIYGKYFKAEIE